MKKIIFLNFFATLVLVSYPPETYLLNALNDKNDNLAEIIALNIPNLDTILSDDTIEITIENSPYVSVANFKKAVATKKATQGGGTGMKKEEVQQMLKDAQVTVPEIKSKADAKNKLANFFDASQVGGKLLTEIGANPQQADAVKNAISAIKPAA